MELQELNMNRGLYKSSNGAVETPVYMAANQDSSREAAARAAAQSNKKDAREVITGTVITACLIKSSDQDDRIEIGQNLDSVLDASNIGSLDFSQAKGLDYLVAYRPGSKIGFILTGIGMVYIGYGMPATKTISLIAGQTLVLQTTSEHLWTMTKLGTGKYKITHNLNSRNTAISAIPTDASTSTTGLFCSITSKGVNSFVVEIYDTGNTHNDSDFDCVISVFN